MRRTAEQLRDDAQAIWRAAVDAVRSETLVQRNVIVEGHWLHVGEEAFDLRGIGRIVVVGAGKAGAGMAAGLECALGERLMAEKRLDGWVNVPEDCLRPLARIRLHAARPAGVNEPTAAGVAGAEEILRRISSLADDDLCLCLLSGGGSALLPAPVAGVSLEDKQQLTRLLSAAGANIRQLNTVRKHLSRIKGGGLARACRRGTLAALIISDVPGDPLDVIASGPTVSDTSTPADALQILEQLGLPSGEIPRSVWHHLQQAQRQERAGDALVPGGRIVHLLIGNNAVAVDAAGIEAERRGYSHAMHAATALEGAAEDVGRQLAAMAVRMRDQHGPDCLITGGEPTVALAPPTIRGLGGRNQQLVLAAAVDLVERAAAAGMPAAEACRGLILLSGGTDGEDGPTDAAGAWFDAQVAAAMAARSLDPADFLRRNDAYHFFGPLGALLKTGPTHTNVCDVRVVLVERIETPGG